MQMETKPLLFKPKIKKKVQKRAILAKKHIKKSKRKTKKQQELIQKYEKWLLQNLYLIK